MESILDTIKKMLGVESEYEAFDVDIIVGINSALMALHQIGVGEEPFLITGKEETWNDYFSGRPDIESIKTYIFLKVKMGFDPPTSSFVLEAQKELLKEYEWRIYIQCDRDKDWGDKIEQ